MKIDIVDSKKKHEVEYITGNFYRNIKESSCYYNDIYIALNDRYYDLSVNCSTHILKNEVEEYLEMIPTGTVLQIECN
jgi:hypothetical protein